MNKRNPYEIDRYSAARTGAMGVTGAFRNMAGLICCLVAMAALCLGMIYIMWKATGK